MSTIISVTHRLWKIRGVFLLINFALDLKTTLGVAIKTERSALGISQEQLAERAGLHRTYVSDVERGTRNPSIAIVERLADALELPISALFDRASHAVESRESVEVLLVEDDTRDLQRAARAFERARIINPLHVVRDGVAALEFLFATGSYLHRSYAAFPNLILLDLDLPKRSGLEVLQRIRADELTKNIPVIVLTRSRRDRDLAECRRLEVEACLVKPIDFEHLHQVIAKLNLAWRLVKPTPAENPRSKGAWKDQSAETPM
jgi:CheY-like chemotaxis protein